MAKEPATTKANTKHKTKQKNTQSNHDKQPIRANAVDRVRRAIRVHPDVDARAEYWSSSHGLSVNQYMAEAIAEKVAREAGDFDTSTLSLERLGELIDRVESLTRTIGNLQSTVIHMSDRMTTLASGGNYLLGDDELDEHEVYGG